MGPRFKGSKSSSKRWAYVEKYGRLLAAIAQSGAEGGVLPRDRILNLQQQEL